MDRPVCVLIHWLVTGNIAVFVAIQMYMHFALGKRELYSLTWFIFSALAMFVHILFTFIHAWLAGDPITVSGDSPSGSDGESSGG